MRRKLGAPVLYAMLLLGAVVTLTPLLWMIAASFMHTGEAATVPPRFIPREATLEHYRALFTRLDLTRCLLNSSIISVSVTLLSLLINSMAGYAFGKLRFPGRERLFRVLLMGLMIPAQVGMLPLFLLLKQMGLVNTYAGVFIPYLANIFGIFLIRQYVQGVPDDLLDAARIDGAGEFRIFRVVVLPLIRPILVTLAAFTFISVWNDFLWPLIMLSDEAKYTLPVALAGLVGEHVQDTELMMAGSVITTLPVLAVFLFFQRVYVKGIMAGGVKG
ncbi:MAG: carbohydrate ABC transporter permease [Candidatus Eisenbacteria bacterium]|nr:carbohydrate ABC transporter permease [Candidatus Eisenbacteria bacterium]